MNPSSLTELESLIRQLKGLRALTARLLDESEDSNREARQAFQNSQRDRKSPQPSAD